MSLITPTISLPEQPSEEHTDCVALLFTPPCGGKEDSSKNRMNKEEGKAMTDHQAAGLKYPDDRPHAL
jgi:hypothetical protein